MSYIDLHFWIIPTYIYIFILTHIYICMHVHYLDQSDYLHGSCLISMFPFQLSHPKATGEFRTGWSEAAVVGYFGLWKQWMATWNRLLGKELGWTGCKRSSEIFCTVGDTKTNFSVEKPWIKRKISFSRKPKKDILRNLPIPMHHGGRVG